MILFSSPSTNPCDGIPHISSTAAPDPIPSFVSTNYESGFLSIKEVNSAIQEILLSKLVKTQLINSDSDDNQYVYARKYVLRLKISQRDS